MASPPRRPAASSGKGAPRRTRAQGGPAPDRDRRPRYGAERTQSERPAPASARRKNPPRTSAPGTSSRSAGTSGRSGGPTRSGSPGRSSGTSGRSGGPTRSGSASRQPGSSTRSESAGRSPGGPSRSGSPSRSGGPSRSPGGSTRSGGTSRSGTGSRYSGSSRSPGGSSRSGGPSRPPGSSSRSPGSPSRSGESSRSPSGPTRSGESGRSGTGSPGRLGTGSRYSGSSGSGTGSAGRSGTGSRYSGSSRSGSGDGAGAGNRARPDRGQGRGAAGRSARPAYGADRDQARERKGQDDRYDDREMRGPRRWGGLARRGAGRATSASDAWRSAGAGRDRERERERADGSEGEHEAAWQPEEWIDEGELRDEAAGAVGRSRAPREPAPAPDRGRSRAGRSRAERAAAEEELRGAVAPNRMARFEQRLDEASDAFRRERYEDARRILRPLADQAPGASSVRELYGLTLYRLGRWAQARRELEAFRTQTGSTEQHPVLADANRALGRYDDVEELWEELRAASPSAELVAEGRIVTAGALADQGKLEEAIDLLAAASKPTKRPQLHHLRIAYALADLYERAGELPRARELFGLVAANDPDFVDIQARLRALR